MSGKELGYDVVYRGETRNKIAEGTYVFFQRELEYGGGYWFGQVDDGFFKFMIESPVSLREGIKFLMLVLDQAKDIMVFDDSLDDFQLRGE